MRISNIILTLICLNNAIAQGVAKWEVNEITLRDSILIEIIKKGISENSNDFEKGYFVLSYQRSCNVPRHDNSEDCYDKYNYGFELEFVSGTNKLWFPAIPDFLHSYSFINGELILISQPMLSAFSNITISNKSLKKLDKIIKSQVHELTDKFQFKKLFSIIYPINTHSPSLIFYK